MGPISRVSALVAAVLVALFLASCSGGDTQGTRIGTTGIREATAGGPATTATMPGTMGMTGGMSSTTGKIQSSLPVTLRVEGDWKTVFSGICSSGNEDTVIRGVVPKRFTYDLPKGRKLECRIQKQDSGKGSLRVVLLSRNTTRSVQQTNTKGGTINVSYSGN